MWIAVIPAYNEAETIEAVLQNLIPCNFHKIILVANGCNDGTEEIALRSPLKNQLEILPFPEPLGLDIPRAIGAAYAQRYQPQGLVFLDGDMNGQITGLLLKLLQKIKRGVDLALTNCYPTLKQTSDLALKVLEYRKKVNEKLGLFSQIGYASPSHGPHALSAHLLAQIPIKILAIPPLTLAFAAKNNFKIEIAATFSHELLGSQIRSAEHAENIADTIIGDCLEALRYLEGTPLEKILRNPHTSDTHAVYRKARRFDILDRFINSVTNTNSSP